MTDTTKVTKVKVERTIKVGLRPRAECNAHGCDWQWPSSMNTREMAKDHVRTHEHPVLIETKTIEEWEPM